MTLTPKEKYFLAVGICLAGDYFHPSAKAEGGTDEINRLAMMAVLLADKLGITAEHDKAMARTAEIGSLLRSM